MRLRNVKNAYDIVNNSKYVIKEYINNFNNKNPLHLEIGCGKGDYIINMALKYPKINFIGIEKYESVLVRAIQKVENMEIPNLRFMCFDAKEINSYFKQNVNILYLNFSDPWPKKRHAKRRLTSDIFLNLYDSIFEKECHIIQKTDNIGLFAYSITSLSEYGYTLKRVSLDLANEDIDNVETEYEKKFKNKGYKINYLEAVKK